MAERRISETERRGRWNDLARELRGPQDAVIVENDESFDFVVITLEQYRELVEERRARQSAEAMARWDTLAAEIGDRNADLSEEEIEELANEFAEEFARELVAEGKIRFASE